MSACSCFGALSDATIEPSSGYDSFDAAAIWAARRSAYKPAGELNLVFAANKIGRQASVFITFANGTIYTFGYTMSQATPFDPNVPPEISGFCG